MWQLILEALWYFAPAGFANVVPILVAQLPILDKLDAPLDGGKSLNGKRLLGDHKTVRGLVAGVVAAFLTLLWQRYLVDIGNWPVDSTWFDYTTMNIVVLALAFGIGALGGDAVKSFFKRQMNIQPGKSWVPFDQTDYIIGGLFLSVPFTNIHFEQIIMVIVIWTLIHPLSTFIGWLFGLKDSPL